MRVWFPNPLAPDVIADLQARVPGAQISSEFHAATEVLIDARLAEEDVARCPNLRIAVLPFAGIPAKTAQMMKRFSKVTLHNLHHNAPDTAETAIALLMAAAKATVPMDQALRRNDWRPRYEVSRSKLLLGSTAVLLGYGEVGKRIGTILEAMGMRVLPVRRSGGTSLDEALPQADVLVVTVPLTPETEGMVGEREIAMMPDGAIIINVARGPIIDEQAFYQALRSGKLHAGGSDVWYQYPREEGTAVPTKAEAPPSASNTPPSRFPFGELPNMVLSPHRGGANQTTERNRVVALAELLQAAVDGKPVPNLVDLDRGY